MAAWDPMGESLEEDEQEEEISDDEVGESELLVGMPGLETFDERSVKKLSKALNLMEAASCPWKKAPNCKPDKSWYKPTCGIDNWAHTDVKIQVGQGIGYITLSRPDHKNTLNDSIMHGLMDAVFALLNPDIRIIVIMAEGKFFSAGDDETVLKHKRDGTKPGAGDGSVGNRIPMAEQPAHVMKALRNLGEAAKLAGAFGDGDIDLDTLRVALFWQTLTRIQAITIALVDGIAMGSGLGLCSCVDMVIATSSSYFSVDDGKRGLLPALILPYLVQKLNPCASRHILCSGRNMSANEAKALGLAQEVCEDVTAGHAIIKEICEVSTLAGPRSVEKAKELVAGVAGAPITETVQFYTAYLLAQVTVSDEARDGMVCLQKKVPKPWEEKPITPLY